MLSDSYQKELEDYEQMFKSIRNIVNEKHALIDEKHFKNIQNIFKEYESQRNLYEMVGRILEEIRLSKREMDIDELIEFFLLERDIKSFYVILRDSL